MCFDIFQRLRFFLSLLSIFVPRCIMLLQYATSRHRCSPILIRNVMTRTKAYAMPFNTLYVISGAKISTKVNYATIAAKPSSALTHCFSTLHRVHTTHNASL